MAHLRIQKMTFRGFGFLVRMRNQQIFEANSGFKICLLRFHFSMFEAKTGLKFEAVFGLKNRVGLPRL